MRHSFVPSSPSSSPRCCCCCVSFRSCCRVVSHVGVRRMVASFVNLAWHGSSSGLVSSCSYKVDETSAMGEFHVIIRCHHLHRRGGAIVVPFTTRSFVCIERTSPCLALSWVNLDLGVKTNVNSFRVNSSSSKTKSFDYGIGTTDSSPCGLSTT